MDGCGWRELPCLSIAAASAHLKGATEILLVQGRHPAETSSTILKDDVSVTGATSGTLKEVCPLLDSEGAAVFVSNATNVNVTRIGFIFTRLSGETEYNIPLFLLSAGTLMLSSITVTSSGEVGVNAPLFAIGERSEDAPTLTLEHTTIGNEGEGEIGGGGGKFAVTGSEG